MGNKLRSDLLAKRKEARQSKAKGDVQSATIMYDDDDETYTQTNLEVWTYFSNHRFIHAGTGMYGESMNIESVGDSTPASYSNDMRNWDFHAFEVDPNHGPVYVRGTYGHFGYFEGEVYQDYEDHSKLHAFVKWMEADDRPGVHATLSGGAVLKYDMEYGDVHGERWRSDSHAGPWYENSVTTGKAGQVCQWTISAWTTTRQQRSCAFTIITIPTLVTSAILVDSCIRPSMIAV